MSGEIGASLWACRRRYTSIRVSIERDSIERESDKGRGQPRNDVDRDECVVILLIDGKCTRSSFDEGIFGKIAIDKSQ